MPKIKAAPVVCKAVRERSIDLHDQDVHELNVFEENSKPEHIVKMFPSLGQIWYLLKFQNRRKLEFLDSEVVNEKWPQLVIRYLEKCVRWV